MNWRKEAANDLRELRFLENYVKNYPDMMETLNARMMRVHSGKDDAVPVSGGGGTQTEDDWLECIVKKERLSWQCSERKMKIFRIKEALALLEPKERRALELFYIDRPRNHVDRLCEELGYEKSQVYRLKDGALRNFTIALYGVTDD